jgi:eukaryotic-like serine/threonine-protein kinase
MVPDCPTRSIAKLKDNVGQTQYNGLVNESHLEPGGFIDRYELVREVARGGMGQVWEARLKRTHGFEKKFALKTLLPHLASQEAFRSMFLDEMRIASSISHPHVCEVLDFGETGDILFLALEWLEGLSLQKWLLSARKLGVVTPPVLALRMAADIAGGLHAAHELRSADGTLLNVMHRDVTPHNLIVRADGVCKLVDFGIAKARNRLSEDTAVGTAKGKLRYMAPEQVRAAPSDRRADVRALGAVLYALLSNRLPYQELGDADMLMHLLRGERIGPPVEAISSSLQALVDCATATSPDDRFATARAFGQAIEGLHPEIRAPEVQGQIADFMKFLQGEGPYPQALAGVPRGGGRSGNLPNLGEPELDAPTEVAVRPSSHSQPLNLARTMQMQQAPTPPPAQAPQAPFGGRTLVMGAAPVALPPPPDSQRVHQPPSSQQAQQLAPTSGQPNSPPDMQNGFQNAPPPRTSNAMLYYAIGLLLGLAVVGAAFVWLLRR